jgi:hypothetical protein
MRQWIASNVVDPLRGSHNGPLELIVQNTSTERYAMTELRAGNDGGCFNNLLVTGANYNDPGNGGLSANEGGIVSESTCARMHVKANAGEIKFTTVGPHPVNEIYPNMKLKDGVVHLAIAECLNAPQLPGMAGYFCGDNNGTLWWVPRVGSPRAL